jgi:DNA-binding transcriptional LysR family regulator
LSIAQLDLNLLVVLDLVITERSVVRAARRLHVTPSAISNSLARLRAVVGDPLVIRSGRGIIPTPRAAELAPLLRRALGDLERAVQKDAFDAATTTKQFTLAIADAGQIARLPRIVTLLAREMPRAQLRVVGIDTYVSSGGLAGSEVDVVVGALDDRSPGVHMLALYQETSVLVARRRHRQARRRLGKAQLAALQHVDVQVAPGRGYRELARHYARLGIERQVAVVVPSFIAAAAVVAETDFVATLPTSLLEFLESRLGLERVQAPAPTVALEVRLAWHDRTHDDPGMTAFRDLVARATRDSSAEDARSVRKRRK